MSSITGNGTGHIYYNITLTNNDTSDSGTFPPVSFTETRNTPFLNCPVDYNMSVVRFFIDTPTLPVVTVQPVLGGAVDNLIYAVRVAYTAITPASTQVQSANVQYVSEGFNDASKPVAPIGAQDIENPYYNIFSYNAFILMINAAIATAYGNLTNLPATGVSCPYLSWDTGGNLAILTMSTGLVSSTVGTLTISFNTSLFTLFSSFNSFKISDISNKVWYQLVVDTGPSAVISSNLVTVGGVSTQEYFYQVIQEYTTCPLWTPIESIVFTTSMLPINPELTAAPVIYNDNKVFQSVGTNANLTNVLTDFIVTLGTGTEYKPNITYTPSGEYRLTGLFGTSPASSIQVNVYYKNRFGTLIPLTLGFGCSASIKIMFRRKDFSNVILTD